MTLTRRAVATGQVVLALAVLTLAGCATSTPVGRAATAGPAIAAGPVSITVGTLPGGRQYLTDNAGRSLYLFVPDTATRSTCNGVCATNWPPLAGSASTGTGLAGTLTTITRDDGSVQAAYHGHPLYYFLAYKTAGDIKGQGLTVGGGLWYLLDPSGQAITTVAAPTSSGLGGY